MSASASPTRTAPWPVEIRLKQNEKLLEIDFDDGSKFKYPAELLRVESPS
ncbi:MAG TPA: gamma-butyrobetaine hydroxylase-like domain-containing protein, partial [Verrucomicrobiae bacterium]|nr:gamma-butyrobetaine hydroxylase-like domain-containing protein [Verrucomicrobiae bacterium]